MDADVTSIETARSDMELLGAFLDFAFPNEIGPEVWNLHSPRVLEASEMAALLQRASSRVPPDQLW